MLFLGFFFYFGIVVCVSDFGYRLFDMYGVFWTVFSWDMDFFECLGVDLGPFVWMIYICRRGVFVWGFGFWRIVVFFYLFFLLFGGLGGFEVFEFDIRIGY